MQTPSIRAQWIALIAAAYRVGGLAAVALAARTTEERVAGWVAASDDLAAALAAADAETESREPRPWELWATQGGKGERYIVLPERWENGLYAGYRLRCEDGSPTALYINDLANARAEMGWTFVRDWADPTSLAILPPADDDAIALWLHSDEGMADGDRIGTADVADEAAYVGDVRRLARAFTALVAEVRGLRQAGGGGAVGGSGR